MNQDSRSKIKLDLLIDLKLKEGMNEINRFKLQLISEKDSQSLFSMIEKNQSRLEDFFAGTLAETKSLQSTQEYCKEIEVKIKKKEYFPYLIIEKKSYQPVGLIDVKNINWDIPKAELGAFIDVDFEGQGIITELTSNLINQLITQHNFKKLLCRVAEQNKRSVKVIERMGFTLEGIIKRDYRTTKGELVDLMYYGKLFG